MGRKATTKNKSSDAIVAVSIREGRPNVIVFYSDRPGKKFREFSNFFSGMPPSTFVLPAFAWRDGLPKSLQCEFSEQAIMLSKAAMMGDVEAFHDIERAGDPKSCKSLGRGVRNFDEELWMFNLEDTAFEVVRQKFESSSELRRLLLSTGEKIIAEAAPNDSTWGIGLSVSDDRSLDPAQWCGQNVLGYALMRVRSHLRGEVLPDMARLAADAGHSSFCGWVHLANPRELQEQHTNTTIEEQQSTIALQQCPSEVEPPFGFVIEDEREEVRTHVLRPVQELAAQELVQSVPADESPSIDKIRSEAFSECMVGTESENADVQYVTGNATKAGYGKGKKIIAHIVNDKGKWGKGFVMALSKEFGDGLRRQYFEWHRDRSDTDFRLGSVQFVQVKTQIHVANMVGQHGTLTGSQGPPVRYEAVAECLQTLGKRARDEGASVHMPRIACGLAGGQWETVGPMVENMSAMYGICVYVYDI